MVGVLSLLDAGCRRDGRDESGVGASPPVGRQAVPPAPGLVVKDYPLKGVVRKVDKDSGRVTIRHEAIPGLMGAMTMPFSLEDPAMLDRLRPGDAVEATLRVREDKGAVYDYALQGLTVTTQPSRHDAIDLSKAKVPVRERPPQLEVGAAVPDFAMTTQEGKVIRLSELRGNVVVLTFIYTRCPLPDFCPLMDRKFGELSRKIATFPARADHVRLVSLSFDPEHDTPEVLRKHAEIRGAAPPLWTYAVASHDELAKVAAPLGLVYEPGTNEIAHNLSTAVIDPLGRLARLDVGTQRNRREATDLLKTIYALLPGPSK